MKNTTIAVDIAKDAFEIAVCVWSVKIHSFSTRKCRGR